VDTALTERAVSAVERYRPFIRRYVAGLQLREHDIEDCMSHAREAAWKAAPKFRTDGGKQFDGFLLDCVKRRLLDLRRHERRKSRAPWFNRCSLEHVTACTEGAQVAKATATDIVDSLSTDSATIVRAMMAGHGAGELAAAGVPDEMMEQARTEVACRMIEDGPMELRFYLEERARELQLSPAPQPDETDYDLMNRILSRFAARSKKLRVVPVPENGETKPAPRVSQAGGNVPSDATAGAITGAQPCDHKGCDKAAAPGEEYCSIACAVAEMDAAGRIPPAPRQQTRGDLEGAGYTGTAGEESITALANPYKKRAAAHWCFEVFREAGLSGPGFTKEEMAEKLAATCKRKRITLKVPHERVRRCITETRRLGFELLKDDAGRFRLTGRRV
jgi:DNA-directed RNA polymerase specialized sigma24 family protein